MNGKRQQNNRGYPYQRPNRFGNMNQWPLVNGPFTPNKMMG